MECKIVTTRLEIDHYCRVCGAKVIRKRLTLKTCGSSFPKNSSILKIPFWKPTSPYLPNLAKSLMATTKECARNTWGIQLLCLGRYPFGNPAFHSKKILSESLDISVFTAQNVPRGTFNVDWVYDYYSLIVLVNLPIYALMAYLVFTRLSGIILRNTWWAWPTSLRNTPSLQLLSLPPLCMLGNNFYIIGSLFNLLLLGYTAYCYKNIETFLGGNFIAHPALSRIARLSHPVAHSIACDVEIRELTGNDWCRKKTNVASLIWLLPSWTGLHRGFVKSLFFFQ